MSMYIKGSPLFTWPSPDLTNREGSIAGFEITQNVRDSTQTKDVVSQRGIHDSTSPPGVDRCACERNAGLSHAALRNHVGCMRRLCVSTSVPAMSFSSSSISSLRSCSFPMGCVAGIVTPGIWGRQHGGVLAMGEFRHSSKNFLS